VVRLVVIRLERERLLADVADRDLPTVK